MVEMDMGNGADSGSAKKASSCQQISLEHPGGIHQIPNPTKWDMRADGRFVSSPEDQ